MPLMLRQFMSTFALQAGDLAAVVMDVAEHNVEGEANILHAQPNEG